MLVVEAFTPKRHCEASPPVHQDMTIYETGTGGIITEGDVTVE